MNADNPKPPPFYCPSCGKKHRADLAALQGTSGATAKVTCARCACVMSLRLGDDGLPTCEHHEIPETTSAPAAAAATPPAAGPSSAGGDMPKPNPLAPVLVAAVVAAVISFVVVQVTGSSPSPAEGTGQPAPDSSSKIAALEAQNAALQDRIAQLEAAATHAASDTKAQLVVLSERLGTMETAGATLAPAVAAAQAAAEDVKDVKGRVEANYVSVRALTKRVTKLEGN